MAAWRASRQAGSFLAKPRPGELAAARDLERQSHGGAYFFGEKAEGGMIKAMANVR